MQQQINCSIAFFPKFKSFSSLSQTESASLPSLVN